MVSPHEAAVGFKNMGYIRGGLFWWEKTTCVLATVFTKLASSERRRSVVIVIVESGAGRTFHNSFLLLFVSSKVRNPSDSACFSFFCTRIEGDVMSSE